MKLFKNIILFVAFSIAVIVGLYGECANSLAKNLSETAEKLKNRQISSAIGSLKNTDSISNDKLLYHDQLIDVDSIRSNLINTRYFQNKGNTVKCESDMLAMINQERFNIEHLSSVAEKISELQGKSEALGAKFIYLAVPEKGYYQTFPSNITDYSKVNFDDYLNCMIGINPIFAGGADE